MNVRKPRLLVEALEDRAVPATFAVSTLADSGDGSLRAAVTLANAAPDADTIVFDGAAVGGTITLATVGGTQFGPNALEVTSPITITGGGETIARGGAVPNFRLFYVSPTGNLSLSNLTLSNGLARGGNGGTDLGDDGGGGGGGLGAGGAIYNQGTLTITGSTLSGNTARGGDGGAGADNAGTDAGGGGGGGGMGGNGGSTSNNGTDGGAGGGGFSGSGGGGTLLVGGGGGGTTADAVGAAGGVANGGTGGATTVNGGPGGLGGGGGGAGDEATGGTGGIGGGGGGGGENDDATANGGGAGGFGGGGGGGGEDGAGGAGGFGGGGGGGANGGVPTARAGGAGGNFAGNGGGTQDSRLSGGGGGGAGLGGAVFNDGGTITITGSTLSTNTATGGTGGVAGGTAAAGGTGGGAGGGLFNNFGTVTIAGSTVTQNNASSDGGGLTNTATLTITGSTISGNTAGNFGGGVRNLGTLTIDRSTIATNQATGNGGGINNGFLNVLNGTVVLTNSTLSGNTSQGPGGGLRNVSPVATAVQITNVTFVGNTAQGGAGGGINTNAGTTTIVNATITGNADASASVNRAGGVSVEAGATVTLANSVVANNTTADTVARDVRGTFVAAASRNNFLTFVDANTNLANGVNGNVVGADPLLGPLQFNGGSTQTRLPLAGSPLINGGNTASVPAGTLFDQRGSGFLRVIAPAVDIGAVEVQPPFPLLVSGQANGSVAVFVPNSAGAYPAAPAATVAPFGANGVNARAAAGDVNGDGFADSILVTGPGVPIRVAVISGADNTTVLVAPFDPFGGNFTGGGYVAAGDLDGDGRDEFVVTPDEGGGPRVSVFTRNPDGTTTVRANFLGIDDAAFRGGARAALGDVNGDGTLDVVVAAGFGGGPRTAIFTGQSVLAGSPARVVGDFFAFPGTDATNLRNGSFVAAGDVTGDGLDDLIFGGGPGGAPRVFILSGALVSAGNVAGAQAAPVANFFVAGNANDRGGVRVAAVNADGDTRADVATGSGEGSPAKVRVYLGANFAGGGEPGTFQDIAVFGGGALPGGVFIG